MSAPKLPLTAERILAKATREGGCLIWTGTKTKAGYGLIDSAGKRHYVHRAIYELQVAGIPAGLVIDHLCKHRDCVNVAHMEVVSVAENVRRGNHWRRDAKTCQRGHQDWKIVPSTGQRLCRTCRREYTKRWGREAYGHKPRPLYRVTHPDGTQEVVKNLKAFCTEHGIRSSLLHHVASGNRKHHRGYKAERLPGE